MSALAQYCAWWWGGYVPALIQASVLLLVALLVDRCLPRRTWPQLRLAIWSIALVKLIVPASWTPPWSAAIAPIPILLDPPQPLAWWVTWVPIASALSALSVAGIVLAAYRRKCRELLRTSSLAPEPVQSTCDRLTQQRGMRPVEVRVGGSIGSPYVTGLWRPFIVIDRALVASLQPTGLEHVLLHELAHVSRLDLWKGWLLTLSRCVYWFHPLIWIATRRMQLLIEQCCDRTVMRQLDADTGEYARSLLQVAAHAAANPSPPGLSFVIPRYSLAQRLELIETSQLENRWLRRVAVVLAAAAIWTAVVPLARSAESATRSVATWIDKPPGCLPLRYLVLERLAQEENKQ
jgi:beta-lactamase regulating signal transducer with metallopeptidase domain